MSNGLPVCHFDFTLKSGLPIRKGSDWIVYVGLTMVDENGFKTPINLTGYTGRCAIKANCGDADPLASPVVSIHSGPNGIMKLYLASANQTNLACPGKRFYDVKTYVYDVVLTKSGENFRVLEGSVDVSPRVTDDNDQVIEIEVQE